MGTISQRSVNIRELERACGAMETAQSHINYVLQIFATAIHDIQSANEDVPETYLHYCSVLLPANDGLDVLIKSVKEIADML